MIQKPEYTQTWFCISANLRKACRAVTQFYSEVLLPAGVEKTQFTLLVTISMIGQPTITDLTDALLMDQTTVTRSIHLLKAKGWVTSAVGTDKRTRLVTLTESGDQVVAEAFGLWQEAQGQMVSGLGQADADRLLELLEKAISVTQRG